MSTAMWIVISVIVLMFILFICGIGYCYYLGYKLYQQIKHDHKEVDEEIATFEKDWNKWGKKNERI